MAMIASDLAQARKLECELDPLYFDRYFFKKRYGSKMIVAPHHEVMAETREKVFSGEIKRLIVNVPPRYTKTEFWSIGLPAKGLAINPRARFLNLSYSQKLALKNSSDTRNIIKSKPYTDMWAMTTRNDTDSKEIWFTNHGGGLVAGPAGGQVTGFGAGLMESGFTGCLGIDDPVKPSDAYSETIRQGVNDQYNETIASRVATEDVPIVLVMQRIHYDDLSGYLLRGGSGEQWHHLNLPVIIDNSTRYPEENTHGIPIEHGLPDGWLWPYKHNEEHRVALSSHKRRWHSQYLQTPKKFDEEGALWTEKMINAAIAMPQPWKKIRTVIAVDPAVTNNEDSDETGIVAASSYTDNNFSVDADYTCKVSTQQWALRAIEAYNYHDADAIVAEVNQGGDLVSDALRNNGFGGRIIKIHASKGKYARAEPVAALYEQGRVKHAAGLGDYESEIMSYVPFAVKKSPNRLDAGVYALRELSGIEATAGVFGR